MPWNPESQFESSPSFHREMAWKRQLLGGSKPQLRGARNFLRSVKPSGGLPSKLLEPIRLWQRKKGVQHEPAEIPVGPGETYPDKMMRTRHDLVMKLGIQETFEARGAIRSATGTKSGVRKIKPIAVDDGKISQDF